MSPAPDEVTSTTATGAIGQYGGAAFTATHWSVVLEAQGESPAAQEALEKLCRTYWRPIFAFLRRQGIGPAEAEDITQGFFGCDRKRQFWPATVQVYDPNGNLLATLCADAVGTRFEL